MIKNTLTKTSRMNASEKLMKMRLESGGMEMILSCQIQNLAQA